MGMIIAMLRGAGEGVSEGVIEGVNEGHVMLVSSADWQDSLYCTDLKI